MHIAVIGGGVAGLSAAMHLVEIHEARGKDAPPLAITLIAPLIPSPGSPGNGVGGKAMSRSYEGYFDTQHGMDRQLIYGPMLPYKGVVPHGYHVLWDYRNLRRLLGDPGDGMGILRPPPEAGRPGGSNTVASFQGNMADPSPGGPSIALVGLVDPEHPATATRRSTRTLMRYRGRPLGKVFSTLFNAIFGRALGVDPLAYADLLFTTEMDLELRLALILGSVTARNIDPERHRVHVRGQQHALYEVTWSEWLEAELVSWGARRANGLAEGPKNEVRALLALASAHLDSKNAFSSLVRALTPDDAEDDLIALIDDFERLLADLPRAIHAIAEGYPLARTFHMRFAPDGTFTSPYAFDAASAVRSLQLCFLHPRAGRAWSADGAKIQRLWVRMWERLRQRAEAAGVTLHERAGRAIGVQESGAGVTVQWTAIGGHGGPESDLLWPHAASIRTEPSPADPASVVSATFDAVVPTLNPGQLAGLLPPQAAGRRQLAPLRYATNETLEILLWLRAPIRWSADAAAGMKEACITGLEGPFCLLADYRCGLWSPEELADERPFGPDTTFNGSILESCGGFDDLYACASREDAYGWPEPVKASIRDLVHDPAFFAEKDPRPWVEDPAGWHQRRAGGTWNDQRLGDERAREDWFVASRWLAWGFLRQLSLIQALGPRAVRQLAGYARLLDPRGVSRAEILAPPEKLKNELRYIVMRSALQRSRIFSPGAGVWPLRPVSGLPLAGTRRVFPAGDWTRNGVDVICMEAACVSGLRAARAIAELEGKVPPSAPTPIRVMPQSAWYAGMDPMLRGGR